MMNFGGMGGFGGGIGKPWGPTRAPIGSRCQTSGCTATASAQAVGRGHDEIMLVCETHLRSRGLTPVFTWSSLGGNRYRVKMHFSDEGPMIEWQAQIGPTLEIWELLEDGAPITREELQFGRGQHFIDTSQTYVEGHLVETSERIDGPVLEPDVSGIHRLNTSLDRRVVDFYLKKKEALNPDQISEVHHYNSSSRHKPGLFRRAFQRLIGLVEEKPR